MGATTTLSASPADALQMPPTRGQASDVTCLVLTREPSAMLQEAARWRQAPVPFVASWTTLARGAGPPVRSGQKEGQPRDLCSLRGCGRTIVGVEQHLPLQQDAGHPEQPVGDT